MLPRQPISLTGRAGLTEQAAAAFVYRHGRSAVAILGERAETAEERGHPVAAQSWREMADAAARLLRVGQHDGNRHRRPRVLAPFASPHSR